MSSEISVRITNYISENNLTSLPQTEVLSMMVKSGVLTQAEYDSIINGTIYYSNTQIIQSNTDSVTISNPQQNIPQSTTKQIYHPVFTNLKLDNNRNIDMEQFSPENIKAQFSEEYYHIEQLSIASEINPKANDWTIEITDTRTNTLVAKFLKMTNDDNSILYTKAIVNNTGEITGDVSISDGNISESTNYEKDGSKKITYYKNGDLSQISAISQYLSDDSCVMYEYENSKLTSVTKFNPNGDLTSYSEYINGQLYAERNADFNITKNYIAEKLVRAIINWDFGYTNYAISQSKEDEILNILDGVGNKQIIEIINDYLKQTGRYILNDINKMTALSDDAKQRLTKHFDNLGLKTQEDKELKSRYLSGRLITTLTNTDYNNFKKLLFNTDEIQMREVIRYIGITDSDSTSDGELQKWSTNSLIYHIQGSNLSEEDKLKCINHVIDSLKKYAKQENIYIEDIANDIEQDFYDFSKLDFNFKRLVSRLDTSAFTKVSDKINGKFDKAYNQDSTGDCWLVEGMLSIQGKPNGREILDGLLKKDDKNQTVTVTFPYSEFPPITISYDRIYKSNHLVEGEPDARAIEIAMDEYIKIKSFAAIDSKGTTTTGKMGVPNTNKYIHFSDTNINGGRTELFYQLVLGNYKLENYNDLLTADFNDENQVFTFAYDDKEKITGFNERTKKSMIVDNNHALNILRSDEEFIYLQDPRYPEDTIVVNRDFFTNKTSEITSAYIEKPEKTV